MSVSSFFAGIDRALHTFGAWLEKEWTKVYNSAPTIEKLADSVLAYAGPALGIVLDVIGQPAIGTIVQKVITEAQQALHVASGLIYDFGATPQASTIIQTVEKDLSGLLAAGHITDPKVVAQVQKIVDTIGSLAEALLTALPKAPAPVA